MKAGGGSVRRFVVRLAIADCFHVKTDGGMPSHLSARYNYWT